MLAKLISSSALPALLLLAACQGITDQTVPEQESVAEINNRSDELERAAEEAVNRQIAEIAAEAGPDTSEAVDKTAQ
jgi:serine/threonine protein phosphatase PrpC